MDALKLENWCGVWATSVAYFLSIDPPPLTDSRKSSAGSLHDAYFVECPGSMMAYSMWLAITTTD